MSNIFPRTDLMRSHYPNENSIWDSYLREIDHHQQKELLEFEETFFGATELEKVAFANRDLSGFHLKLIGEVPEEEQAEYSENVSSVIPEKISEYHENTGSVKKEAARRNRKKEGGEGQSTRKIRTTITPDKLQQMNKIFKEYAWVQQKIKEDKNNEDVKQYLARNGDLSNLKAIGERLGLGYSTILHKYREFKATNKVSGGALIASIHTKRKYKKSREIELLIEEAINGSNLYTAVQVAKKIKERFNRVLSRSIISRHLIQMGYSPKADRNKNPSNSELIKDLRKQFVTALTYIRSYHFGQVYYIGQCILFPRDMESQDGQEQGEDESNQQQAISIILLVSVDGIIHFHIRNNPVSSVEFTNFLKESMDIIQERSSKDIKRVFVIDINFHVHYSEQVLFLRQSELSSRNFSIFYIPPESDELSLLHYMIPTIKRDLRAFNLQNIESATEDMKNYFESLANEDLSNEGKEVEESEYKAMNEQNF